MNNAGDRPPRDGNIETRGLSYREEIETRGLSYPEEIELWNTLRLIWWY